MISCHLGDSQIDYQSKVSMLKVYYQNLVQTIFEYQTASHFFPCFIGICEDWIHTMLKYINSVVWKRNYNPHNQLKCKVSKHDTYPWTHGKFVIEQKCSIDQVQVNSSIYCPNITLALPGLVPTTHSESTESFGWNQTFKRHPHPVGKWRDLLTLCQVSNTVCHTGLTEWIGHNCLSSMRHPSLKVVGEQLPGVLMAVTNTHHQDADISAMAMLWRVVVMQTKGLSLH